MLQILLLLSTIVLGSDSFAISGRVIDAHTSIGISDVNLYIPKQKEGTATNTEGYFSLNIESDKKLMRTGNIITVSNGDDEVVEVNPRTNKKVRSYKYEFSDHQGSVQRLPNGNTLIVSGYSKIIDELDDSGEIVWSLETSDRISRAYRYGLKYQGVLEKN